MMVPTPDVAVSAIATDTSIMSSVAVILGAIFVVFQIRQDREALQQSVRQADANADQVKVTMKQLTQNSQLATMDLVMRIYEFADSLEVTRSYVTVVRAKIRAYEDFEKLPFEQQLAFFQICALFESLGFLVEHGFVSRDIVDDMFATRVAWEMTKPFIMGMRKEFQAEDYYFFFERLYNQLTGEGGPVAGEYPPRLVKGPVTPPMPSTTTQDAGNGG
jgi:hypothetical protein